MNCSSCGRALALQPISTRVWCSRINSRTALYGWELLGGAGLGPSQPSMGAEDFSYMTQQCAGAMFRLGVKPADAPARYLHTADFDLDEDALPLGAAMLAATALRLLARTTV